MNTWIPASDRLPEPFVSVLAYVPEKEPLPTVHECYVDNDGKIMIYCGYQAGVSVDNRMEM